MVQGELDKRRQYGVRNRASTVVVDSTVPGCRSRARPCRYRFCAVMLYRCRSKPGVLERG